jgi:hypothetical protein
MLHTIRLHIRYLAAFLMLGILVSVEAQILNDSARQLYGYHSLRYGTESDVFLNRGLNREIDSSLASIQRYGYIYKNGQYSQDLGNWATPLKCVTSIIPDQLGVQTGFNVYDAYEYKADDVKYFDTRSPYAELKYYQGSRGQQSMDVALSRNINAQWNVGLDLRRIVSKKVVGFVQRNDRQAENYAFDFFVSHHSKDKRYYLLATFNYLEAHNFETGGIRPDSTDNKPDDKNDLFDNQLEKVWFKNNTVRSLDKRYNYRVYQHLGILPDEKLQIFYRFDYSYRINRYNDNALASNIPFYQKFDDYTARGIYSQAQIADRTDFNLLDNRLGIKGSVNTIFYAAYLKNRYVTRHQPRIVSTLNPYDTYTMEWYLGGQLRKYFDSTKTDYLEGVGEYGLESTSNLNPEPENNFMFGANIKYKGITATASTWAVSPTMLQSGYRSNLISWDSSFELQNTHRLFVQYAFTKRKVDIIPSVAFNSYTNLIYFTHAGTPNQHEGNITHIQPKFGLRFNLWKIHIYNEFQFNQVSNKSILQMPEYVNATQLFVEAWLFKRATLLQTGFDVLYRSSYRANGYNPLLQQYYVTSAPMQDVNGVTDFNYVNQYVVVDFFVNMQIRTARLFIKMSNLASGWGQPKGYFTTPYYTGIPRTVDFGVSWRFFD